jgi:hypothetical protein
MKSVPNLQKVTDFRRNYRAFYQSSKSFIHPQIIIATIERLSHTSSGPRSLVDALRPTKPRWPTRTEKSHVRCEAASMHRRGRRVSGCSGHNRGKSSIGARLVSITRCGRAVSYDNDQCVEAATWAPAHRIGASAIGPRTRNRQRSPAEYRTRGNW